MKRYLIILFLLLCHALSAQTLVAKLKPEYQHALVGDSIQHKRLHSLLSTLGVYKTKSVLSNGEKSLYLGGVFKLYFQPKEIAQPLVKALQQSGYFQYVEERNSAPHTPMHLPNDPFAQPDTGKQSYLSRIHAYEAWEVSKGDSNMFICVIDNGLDWTHPEFKNKIYYNKADTLDGIDNDNDGYVDNYMGWDFANNDPFPEDSTGTYAHGTEVAGIATANSNNALGIASVGYNTKVLPLKIFGPQGNDYEAIYYGARHGCKVMNLSWGSPGGASDFEQEIINYAAIEHDAVLVGATWPIEQEGVYTYPADYQNVISAVGLGDENGKAIPQTYHYWMDISVPANNIFTTGLHADYWYNSGISLGVPMISGAAALARSKYPWMNSTQIQQLLRLTTDNMDTLPANANFKEKMGHGRLNVHRALTDTTTPGILILQYDMKRMSKDTFSLQFGYKNYLWPTKNLQITIKSVTGGLALFDSIANGGVLKMMDSSSTAYADLKFRILPSNNQYDILRIGMEDTALHYHDYYYFYLDKTAYTDIITSIEKPNLIVPQIKLFPNPSSHFVFLEGEGIEEVSIQDVVGTTLEKKTVTSSLVSFDLGEYKHGVYIAKVRTNGSTYSYKFLKE